MIQKSHWAHNVTSITEKNAKTTYSSVYAQCGRSTCRTVLGLFAWRNHSYENYNNMKSTAKAISSTPSENWAPLKYVNLNLFNLCSTSSSLLQQKKKKKKIPHYQKGNSRTVYVLTLTKCYCSNLLISCNYDQIEQFQVGCATESSKSCRLPWIWRTAGDFLATSFFSSFLF